MIPSSALSQPALLQTLLTRNLEMTGTYLNYLWVALGILAVFCLLVWLGWRGRKRRQSGIPAPQQVPAQLLEDQPAAAAEGMVVGTVKAEDYLDRVAVHQLGLRTTGRFEVHAAGVVVLRQGAPNWLIPAAELTHIRTDRGMVGKFVERDGVILIGWRLGETEVETGFRPRRTEEGHTLMTAVEALMTEGKTDA